MLYFFSLFPLASRALLFDPLRLLKVLPWSRCECLLLGIKGSTLEPLYSRREASMWLDKLNSELIKAEALQSLCTLHVSVDLVKAIGHVVTPGAYSKQHDYFWKLEDFLIKNFVQVQTSDVGLCSKSVFWMDAIYPSAGLYCSRSYIFLFRSGYSHDIDLSFTGVFNRQIPTVTKAHICLVLRLPQIYIACWDILKKLGNWCKVAHLTTNSAPSCELQQGLTWGVARSIWAWIDWAYWFYSSGHVYVKVNGGLCLGLTHIERTALLRISLSTTTRLGLEGLLSTR